MSNAKKKAGRSPLPANPVTQLSNYVTHAELLRLAMKNRCAGIQVEPALVFPKLI